MMSLEMLANSSPEQDYPHCAMRTVYGDRGDFIALVAIAGVGLLLPGLARAMGRHVPTKVLPVPDTGPDIPDLAFFCGVVVAGRGACCVMRAVSRIPHMARHLRHEPAVE